MRYVFLGLLLSVTYSQFIKVRSFSSIDEKELLRNLLVVGDNVLVGSATRLYRLNAENLSILATVSLAGVNRLLLFIDNADVDGGDVLSCQEQDCLLFDSNTLTNKTASSVNDDALVPGENDLVGIAVTNESFFLARERLNTEIVGIASTVSKISYSIDGDQLELSVVGKQQENNMFLEREFLTTFKNNEHVYFVYNLNSESDFKLRIARMCTSDPGGTSGGSPTLTTFTEATLDCSGLSSAEVASATSITIDGQLIVLVTLIKELNNHICSFNVTEINGAMDDKLEECKGGDGEVALQRTGFSLSTNCPMGLTETQQNVSLDLMYQRVHVSDFEKL